MKRAANATVAFALAGALSLAVAGGARADTPPSLWDDARQPGALRDYSMHVDASQVLLRAWDAQHPPLSLGHEQAQLWKAQRRRMLESLRDALVGTEKTRDPYLRYDRAWLALELVSPQEDFPLPLARASLLDAVAILEPLAKELGSAPLSSEVWRKLAECYVRLERPEDEIHAYDEELARAVDDEERAVPLLNQGEAYMRIGHADFALSQFREVVRLSNLMPYGNDLGILAQWDIAVALDRGGDARGGVEAARTAVHMDAALPGPLKLYRISVYNSNVYFVPEYEREWYLALGEAALALDESTASAAATDLALAQQHYDAYATYAYPGDRWAELARRRVGEVGARRAEAEKRARKEKAAPTRDSWAQ